MDISLVVPTHQRMNGVMTLLRSICQQEVESLKIEVLIVSNLYEAQLESSIKSFSKNNSLTACYLYSGIIGVNSARNHGLNHSIANLVLFLDDDVVLENSKYLLTLHSHATGNATAAAIGGRYKLQLNANLSDRTYFNISDSWLTHGQSDNNRAVHLVGGNTLYNKRILGHHLKFNENITFGGAETELNLRLYQAGHSLMLFEDLALLHVTRLSPAKLFKKAFYQGMGRAYHEQVVRPEFWQKRELGVSPERRLSAGGTKWEIYFENLLYSLFEFFFLVGYRHASKENKWQFHWPTLLKCIFIEFFQIGAEDSMHAHDPNARPYHESSLPGFRVRGIYHWIRAHVLPYFPVWRISWFLKHKIFANKWIVQHKIFGPLWSITLGQLWRVSWFLKHKVFANSWIIQHKIFGQLWKIPWFIKHKILVHLWRVPWFLRHKAIAPLWWKIPWLIKHKIFAHLWRFPWFVRNHILANLWRVPWFIKWKIIPLGLCIVLFSITMLFPVNLIGLGNYYVAGWEIFSEFLKRPWQEV